MTAEEKIVKRVGRLFLSDDGFWCDRTKPVEGELQEQSDELLFEECDPDVVCADIESQLTRRDEVIKALVEVVKYVPETVDLVIEGIDGDTSGFPLLKSAATAALALAKDLEEG